jgi:hypothetical protein
MGIMLGGFDRMGEGYRLGVARPFLMLKALFFTLPLKLPSKHWRFNQIDGTNRFSVKSCIRLILGI